MKTIEEFALKAEEYGCEVRLNEPMCRHTTFKIGGPADLFITVHNRNEIVKLYKAAHKMSVPILPLGNGSNLLVSDNGIRGAVITFGGEFTHISLQEDNVIKCGVGVTLARLCIFARDNCLSGLEFAWGIPGSAGGAAFMNAGAYNHEMEEVLISCTHITKDGEIGKLSGEDLNLGYRQSEYMKNGCTILSLKIKLQKGDEKMIAIQMDDLIKRRKSKQPIEMPSAGSVFKRPVGNFAGALIESCGLKGKSVGGAMVSPKHAGFIVNTGGATCSDVLKLIDIIKDTVYQKTNVMLECEVKSIG